MAGGLRLVRRLAVGAVALGAVALLLLAWGGQRAPRELLPDGAAIALEVRDAGDVLGRVEGTRLAAAFTAGPTWAWLARSEAVQAIDGLRAGIGRAIGYTPSRRQVLALLGEDAAVAWYHAGGSAAAGSAPWVAASRLDPWGWPVAAVARVALRLGIGGLPREELGETTVFTVGAGEDAVRFFLTGRLLVAASDRGLLQRASRLAAVGGRALAQEDAWRRAFASLPEEGELRLWLRGDQLPVWAAPGPRGGARAVGAVLAARAPATIDVFVDAPDAAATRRDAVAAPPALALAGPAPLLFHATAGPLPPQLAQALEDRMAAVARRDGTPLPRPPALANGFALAVTGTDEGGLFPVPQGIVAIRMRDAAAARQTLRQLFPAGARSAAGRRGTAFSTRESLPLAGGFELWGAAAGERLVLATQHALIEGLEDAAAGDTHDAASGGAAAGPVDSITALNVTRLLPALRRYAPPLAALLRVRDRRLPDLSRDVELLAAVRALSLTTGATPEGLRARLTLETGDLPATH